MRKNRMEGTFMEAKTLLRSGATKKAVESKSSEKEYAVSFKIKRDHLKKNIIVYPT